jgi:SAM-dependent methyltransferase
VHRYFGWTPHSRRVARDGTVLAGYDNLHSAAYMLTADHLERAIASGRWLDMHAPSKWYMPLEAATTHPYESCGLVKLFPVSRPEDFLLHHMPNTYFGINGISHDEFTRNCAAITGDAGCLDQPRLLETSTRLAIANFDKFHYEGVREDILRLIGDQERGARLLWIGSGEARTERLLAARGLAVTCIALDGVHAATLRSREEPGLDVISGSLDTVLDGLPADAFDVVVLPEVLERTPDVPALLHAARRTLRPGGRFVITSPNLARTRDRRRLAWNEPEFDRDLIRTVSRETLAGWMRQCGLEPKISQTLLWKKQRLVSLPFGAGRFANRIEAVGRRT